MSHQTDVLPIEIDKYVPIPIYHQLQEGIKRLILNGDLQPYDRIPSENDFSKQFEISHMTVRQALNGLANDGYVYRQRGLGTYVAPKYMPHALDKLVGFSEDLRAHGLTPSSRIICYEIQPATQAVADALKMKTGQEVLRIKRLRFADQNPVAVHDAYLGAHTPITRKELEQHGSLYALLESKDYQIYSGVDEIVAIPADQEISQHLGVDIGTPLLQLTRLTEDETGSPIELVIAVYKADFYRYTIRLRR